jgi:hypothetical protein
MRIAPSLLISSLTILLAASSSTAMAKYSEQWLTNADLPQLKPNAHQKAHADVAVKQAKAHAGATVPKDDDPIAAFARPTPVKHR